MVGKRQNRQSQGASLPFEVWAVVSGIIVVASLAVVALLFGARLLGFEVCSVSSGSSSSGFSKGDLLYVEDVDPVGIDRKASVAYVSSAGGKTSVSSVVSNDAAKKALILEGGSSSASGTVRVPYSRVVGEVGFSLPYLGFAYDYITVSPGNYVAMAAGGAIVVLFVAAPLIVGVASKRRRKHDALLMERARAEAARRAALRPSLRPGAVPSPAAQPARLSPQSGGSTYRAPSTTPAVAVTLPADGSHGVNVPGCDFQITLRIERDQDGTVSVDAAGKPSGEAACEAAVRDSRVLGEADLPEATAHEGRAAAAFDCSAVFASEELKQAEMELRAAEKQLDAMQQDARTVDPAFLRARAEIRLAEAELLRAKAEILEKDSPEACIIDRS